MVILTVQKNTLKRKCLSIWIPINVISLLHAQFQGVQIPHDLWMNQVNILYELYPWGRKMRLYKIENAA